MAEYVILSWPNPTDLETIEWVRVNASDGQIIAGPERASLSECVDRFLYTPITVCVPSQDVLLLQAQLPDSSRQRLQQAVPYVLEEQFAEQVENLHFVLSPKPINAVCHGVAVVADSKIKVWRDTLQAHHITPEKMLPDVFALPYHERAWTVFCLEDKAYIRQGVYMGFSIDIEWLIFALERSLAENDEQSLPHPENLYCYNHASINKDLTTFCETHHIKYHQEDDVESLLTLAPAGLQLTKNWNLLSGEYRQAAPMTKVRRLWARVGILCLIWASIVLGGQFYHIHQLRGEYREYRTDVMTSYQAVFPGAQSVNSPRALIGRKLEALSAVHQDLFLPLLTQIGTVLNEHGQMMVQTVNYQSQRVSITLQAPSFADLETLIEALSLFGLQVEQESALSQGTTVEAQLMIMELL